MTEQLKKRLSKARTVNPPKATAPSRDQRLWPPWHMQKD
ncbi:hypothetical protein FHS29_006231 [Saccharothrix tamanrassetensis]|uniref:Uncharacterized protein n=1 Tax=Saccharothrix tamanrassetensis TaxID=1051531 RepID=A0A841CQV9_9PSEU|nr:hypothetical protein [Saccharothrix tamanrassetensis]